MDIKAYISSGILELYVIGALSETERADVESMATQYVEVRQEIFQISNNLEQYARIHGLKVDAGVEANLFKNLPKKENTISERKESQTGNKTSIWKTFSIIFGLISIVLSITLFYKNKSFKEDLYNAGKSLEVCDSLKTQEAEKARIYAQMYQQGTKIVNLTPTENFPEARLRLFYNVEKNSNILQWLEAPSLEPGMVYQLWYFDSEGVPKPLETFDSKKMIWEITYKKEATIYAFTIEPEGGSKTPTLANLIGTASI